MYAALPSSTRAPLQEAVCSAVLVGHTQMHKRPDGTASPEEHAQIIVMLDDRRDEMGWMDDEARRPVNDATLHTQRYMSPTCTSDPTVSQAKQQRTAVPVMHDSCKRRPACERT